MFILFNVQNVPHFYAVRVVKSRDLLATSCPSRDRQRKDWQVEEGAGLVAVERDPTTPAIETLPIEKEGGEI